MRPIACLTILLLASGCETLPPEAPAPAIRVCNPEMPVKLSPAGRGALDSADPLGSLGLDRANAFDLCACHRDTLSAEDAAAICGVP